LIIDSEVERKPTAEQNQGVHFSLVADAIAYLRQHQFRQPQLEELASALEVSESHLQRVFSAWAGVSPKRFLQVLTRDAAVTALRDTATVLEASLEAGLSSPARLHDLTIACDAMTPGEIAAAGEGLDLRYGWAPCPFGQMFVAFTERGICSLSFHDEENVTALLELREEWPRARISEDHSQAQQLATRLFTQSLERGRLHLLLRGTNFQVQVWRALVAVGEGELISYRGLASLAGRPGASRAVGSAMARNRIAYLIPCHRVIREDGSWGNYRWGLERKLALRGWESARPQS